MKIFKPTLNLLLVILLSGTAFAQEIKWGSLQKSTWGSFSPNIIADDSDNLYGFFRQSGKLHLTSYSRSKFKENYDEVMPKLKVDNISVNIEKVSVIKDHFIIIGSYFEKEKKTEKSKKSFKSNIVAFKVDKKTGKLNSNHTELFSVEVEKKSRRGDFDVYVSENNGKVLINHTSYYKKRRRTIATFKLYNNDLELEEEFTEDFKKRDEPNSIDKINNLIIDNEGSIYYLVGLSKFVSLDANKGYEKWEEKINIEKTKPGSVITRLRYAFDKEENINIFGFYREQKAGLKGVYTLKLDYLTKEVVHSEISDFDNDFLDNLKSNRQKKREAKGKVVNISDFFNAIDMIPQEDGSIAISAETRGHKVNYTESGDMNETALYSSMITMKVNPDGKLAWSKYIPKKQLFWQTGIGGSFGGAITVSGSWLYIGSFKGGIKLIFSANSDKYVKHFGSVSGVKDGKLIVIFNDHKANQSNTPKNKIKTMKSVESSRPIAKIYDIETGSVEHKEVKNGKQKDAPLAPSVSYTTSDGSIVVFGQKGKNFKFGELSLN